MTKRTIINKNLKTEIQSYFDRIDDYQEAKDEFIKDVNKILKLKGDDDGVMCKTLFEEALSKFIDLSKNSE